MWDGKTLSVVLMTYAERNSIRRVIEGFFETGVVDEVLVVNNNAEEGTAEEVALTNARQVFEPKQGYGHAIRRGLVEATGDLVLLAEPDGTFLPQDIFQDAQLQRRVRSGARHTHHAGADMAWPKHGVVPEMGQLAEVGGVEQDLDQLRDRSGARFVEIPVNYLPRLGTSSVTGDPLKAFVLGMRMILLVLSYRVKAPRRLPRPEALEGVSMLSSGRKK